MKAANSMRDGLGCQFLAFCFFFAFPAFAQEPSVTDEIIVKATNAAMFQITANMKLTQEQIDAIRPIIEENIVKAGTFSKVWNTGISTAKRCMAKDNRQTWVAEDREQA